MRHLLRSREPVGEIAGNGRRETALVDQRQSRLREAAGRRVADHNDYRGTACVYYFCQCFLLRLISMFYHC